MWNGNNLVRILKNGGVAVMPTDTIYGLVGSALNVPAVNRIYNLKKRKPEKPCIILIGNIDELSKFSVFLDEAKKSKLAEFWPGRVSIIFDCADESLAYLHRGSKTLAFRLPAPEELRDLLLKTGPLVAPSTNLEGMPPAKNISEAKNYFDGSVDLYVDGGNIDGKASKLIKLHKDGTVDILRE
jgi:L-threonylcarbamoyladenylate synthase